MGLIQCIGINHDSDSCSQNSIATRAFAAPNPPTTRLRYPSSLFFAISDVSLNPTAIREL
jgi:hypothetical protein